MSVSRLGKFLGWITKLLNSITVGGGVTGSNIQRSKRHMERTSVSCPPETGSVSLTTSDKNGMLFLFFFFKGAIACFHEQRCGQSHRDGVSWFAKLRHTILMLYVNPSVSSKTLSNGSVGSYMGRTSLSRSTLRPKPDATAVSIVAISAASSLTPLL